ncbi:MAG: RNase P modulator RnpM [Actinomycetota bacterium]
MKSPDPERTCLVCRQRRQKPELLRIVRSSEGEVSVDPTGRSDGRGAYVCSDDPACRRAVTVKGALARALRLTLTPDDLARLATEIEKENARA